MEERIKCDGCGKESTVVRTESNGINAGRLDIIGWTGKCDVLYSSMADKPTSWFFYCGTECQKEHYKAHLESLGLPQETMRELTDKLEEIKKGIPRMAKKTAREVQAIVDAARPTRKPLW